MEYVLVKNGIVEGVIVADAAFIQTIQNEYEHIEAVDALYEQRIGVGPGWTWTTTNGFVAPVVPEPEIPTTPQESKLTRLAFLNRFQDAEAIAIDMASVGNTIEAASLRLYMKKVDAATYIDLQDQKTRDGVLALEAIGILGTGRALEILDTPIQSSERP